MTHEMRISPDQLGVLSLSELHIKAEELVDELGSLGYQAIDIMALMFGATQRLERMKMAAVREKAAVRELTAQEVDSICESLELQNPAWSGSMLAETLRAQIENGGQGMRNFNGLPFPRTGAPRYQEILNVLDRLGYVVNELKKRSPDKGPSQYLPTKLKGKW